MKKQPFLLWFFVLTVWLGSSCSTQIQFNTQKSAEPRFNGIRTVGINTVKLAEGKSLMLRDNLGQWSVSDNSASVKATETLVRKSLVANLVKYSDYQVLDINDLRQFAPTFQQLRPLSGQRLSDLDLLIDVTFAYYASEQSGQKQKVMTFHQSAASLQNMVWVTTQDTSQDKIVTVPYSTSRVDLVAFVEVIKVKNGESQVLKSFNVTLSNELEPMVTSESMVQELSVVITSRILKQISKYSAITKREIDEGSDGEIIELMEAASLDEASKKLETKTAKKQDRSAADLYNLGICYEAMGIPAIALQMYQEAYRLDNSNELYIKAIGELE